MTHWRLLILLLALPLFGCPPSGTGGDDDDSAADDDDDATPPDFAVWSPDFVEPYFDNPGDGCQLALAVENACFRPNPEIRWEGAPEGTVAFALILEDATAWFPHWAIYNIPGDATGLAASISGDGAQGDLPAGSVELDNGAVQPGYLGSCPEFVNQYRWRLWALSEEITSGAGTFISLATTAEELSLGVVEMCHVFDGQEDF